uniref:Uncharacterized protein n=1 Tax=Oryza brachyantha TaxID=4533 RepID=J3LV06_ORYBR
MCLSSASSNRLVVSASIDSITSHLHFHSNLFIYTFFPSKMPAYIASLPCNPHAQLHPPSPLLVECNLLNKP